MQQYERQIISTILKSMGAVADDAIAALSINEIGRSKTQTGTYIDFKIGDVVIDLSVIAKSEWPTKFILDIAAVELPTGGFAVLSVSSASKMMLELCTNDGRLWPESLTCVNFNPRTAG